MLQVAGTVGKCNHDLPPATVCSRQPFSGIIFHALPCERMLTLNEEAMSEALDAISEEANKLLELDLPNKVKEKVELIHSIARYKVDSRTDAEGGEKD